MKFIAISDGVAENEKAVFSNPCNEVIYNWCNNEKFQYVSEAEKKAWKAEKKVADKLVLVSVGNCAQVKNHELLLNAIALMKKKQDICYYHVGFAEGETDKEKELTEKLGICPYVEFLGSTDPMPYLKTADVYLMTSAREGLSIAALEAIFTGMPAAACGSPRFAGVSG